MPCEWAFHEAAGLPVLQRVVYGSQACVALVIERTVLDSNCPEERPDIFILPVQDCIDPHKRGPAFAAWTEFVLALSIGI